MTTPHPEYADLLAAAARIAPYAHVTPVLRSRGLDDVAGCELHFKAEHLQRAGAFKFRGACNAVFALDESQAAAGVVTHSSGNHGGALALAARLRGIACHVVVPDNAVRSKLEAIQAYGAILHTCAPGIAAREAACAQIERDTGATLVHPYTNPRVIAGQGTAAMELLNAVPDLDIVVAPVGGGGLSSGIALAVAAMAPHCRVIGAEPSGAADAHAWLHRGERPGAAVPDTVCDGLRGQLGQINFDVLSGLGVEVLTVDDRATLAALRLFWQRCKQTIEPSSAIALAAVLGHREIFAGRRVGIVLSGGNVDLDHLSALLTE